MADAALRSVDELRRFESAIKAHDGDRTFFDAAAFAWVRDVQQQWQPIRAELDRLLGALDILPGFEDIQVEQAGLPHDRRWKIVPLFVCAQWAAGSEQRCPATVSALRRIPDLKVAMFSILQAGKELPEHRGPYAGVLRYHLGLKVPQPESQCGICVGGDTRHWAEGASLIFDDSHPHSAWNRSNEDCVVLFVDFTRPLPPALQPQNERIIDAINASEPYLEAVRKWSAWEARHGQQLDRALSAPPRR